MLGLFSILFTADLPRKKFECFVDRDKLFAMNTSKNTIVTLIFTLFSCGLLFTGFVETFVNRNEVTTESILIFFIIHFLVGLMALRQFLWLINGKQELSIEKRVLTLVKRGTFLTFTRSYSIDLITNVREAINEDNLSKFEKAQLNISLTRKVLFRQTLGQILFDYKGKTIRVFNDLNKNEKADLIAEICKWKEMKFL